MARSVVWPRRGRLLGGVVVERLARQCDDIQELLSLHEDLFGARSAAGLCYDRLACRRQAAQHRYVLGLISASLAFGRSSGNASEKKVSRALLLVILLGCVPSR